VKTWLLVLSIVVAVFVARGLTVSYLLWRANRLLALMKRYWEGQEDWGEAGGRKREIVRLFRVAQIKEPGVDMFNPTPGGYMHRQASAWDNLFARREDVQQLVFDSFVEAKGYFKDEIRRSFIPAFWPSVFANVPADALVYLGVKPEAVAVRVAKITAGLIEFGAAVFAVWSAAS
jgi:hypothetical protein